MTQPNPNPNPAPKPADVEAPQGTRTKAGGTYGDYVPPRVRGLPLADPSRGAELEQATLPPEADFSQPIRTDAETADPLPRDAIPPAGADPASKR